MAFPIKALEQHPECYRASLTREQAEAHLLGAENGGFVLADSRQEEGLYTLYVKQAQRVERYELSPSGQLGHYDPVSRRLSMKHSFDALRTSLQQEGVEVQPVLVTLPKEFSAFYHGDMARNKVDALLQQEAPHAFLFRTSQKGLSLCYKEESGQVRHFLVHSLSDINNLLQASSETPFVGIKQFAAHDPLPRMTKEKRHDVLLKGTSTEERVVDRFNEAVTELAIQRSFPEDYLGELQGETAGDYLRGTHDWNYVISKRGDEFVFSYLNQYDKIHHRVVTHMNELNHRVQRLHQKLSLANKHEVASDMKGTAFYTHKGEFRDEYSIFHHGYLSSAIAESRLKKGETNQYLLRNDVHGVEKFSFITEEGEVRHVLMTDADKVKQYFPMLKGRINDETRLKGTISKRLNDVSDLLSRSEASTSTRKVNFKTDEVKFYQKGEAPEELHTAGAFETESVFDTTSSEPIYGTLPPDDLNADEIQMNEAASQAEDHDENSRPAAVPVALANASISRFKGCSIDVYRFGRG